MLFINWKKHFDVPNNIYNVNSLFKQSRKIKLYFLSNFVFKLIHKFCFRRTYYYYLDYLFKQRLLIASKNLISRYNKIHKFLTKYNVYEEYKGLFSNTVFYNNVIKRHKKINNVIHYLFIFFFFETLCNYELDSISLYKKQSLLIVSYYLSIKNVNLNKILSNFFISCSSLLSINQKVIKNNKNILFKLYICKYKKKMILYKSSFFFIKSKYIILLYTYIKHLIIKLNMNISSISNSIIQINKFKTILKYSKKYNINTYKYTSVHLSILFKKIHTLMYFYFFTKNKNTFTYYNLLNYYSFINLKNKKSILFYLKNTYTMLKNKMVYVLFKHRKSFYIFLNDVLNKQNWLVGPTNRIRLFRYLTFLCTSIKFSFNALTFLNSPLKQNALSFYYNPLNIRTDLINILNKRKYTKELILLNNTKYIINYHLKTFYGITRKTLYIYYHAIKKVYNIVTLKDLLFFYSYNVYNYLKKNLNYISNNNALVNNTLFTKEKNTFFFIGDVVKISSSIRSFFDKFIIFFNFIFFINPLKLKIKYNILKNVYTFLYYNIQKRLYFSNNLFNNTLKVETSFGIWNNVLLYINKYIIHLLLRNKVVRRKQNKYAVYYKTFIKQSIFFFLKFKNIFTLKSLFNEEVYNNSIIENNITYTFNKYYSKYSLIRFKKQYSYKITKVLRVKNKNRKKQQNKKYRNSIRLNSFIYYYLCYTNGSNTKLKKIQNFYNFNVSKNILLKNSKLLNKTTFFNLYSSSFFNS